MSLKRLFILAPLLILVGAGQVWAEDVGDLTLSGSNFGLQTVTLYNLTGATDGCEIMAPQYNVCNSVNIASWNLQLDFTANVSGLPTSPLVFSSNGPGDVVGPTDFTASSPGYTGESGNPWSLSFDLQNAGCSPDCDAEITEILFSGTLDQTTLDTGSDPVNLSNDTPYFSSGAFNIDWIIPSSDYTANPDSLFDSTDIVIPAASSPSSVPEPGSLLLIFAGGIAIAIRKRTFLASVL